MFLRIEGDDLIPTEYRTAAGADAVTDIMAERFRISVVCDKSAIYAYFVCLSGLRAGRFRDFAVKLVTPCKIVRYYYEYYCFTVIRSRSEIIRLSGFEIQVLHRKVVFVIPPVKAESIRDQVHVFVINTAVCVIH